MFDSSRCGTSSRDTEERRLGHVELTARRNHVERQIGQGVHHAVWWAQRALTARKQRIDCEQRSKLRKPVRMVGVHGLLSHNHEMVHSEVLCRSYHFDIGQSRCSLVLGIRYLCRNPAAKHRARDQRSLRQGMALFEEGIEGLSRSCSLYQDELVATIFERCCWTEAQRLVVMVSGGTTFLVGPNGTLRGGAVCVSEDVSLFQNLFLQSMAAERVIVVGHSGCDLEKAVCLCEVIYDDQRRNLVPHVVRDCVVVHHMASASGDVEVIVVVCLDVGRICVAAFWFVQGIVPLYRGLQDSSTFF